MARDDQHTEAATVGEETSARHPWSRRRRRRGNGDRFRAGCRGAVGKTFPYPPVPAVGEGWAGTPSPVTARPPLHSGDLTHRPLTWSNIGMHPAVFIHRAGQGLFYRHASGMLGACPSSVLYVSPGFLLLRLIGRGFVRVRVSRRRIGSGRGVAFLLR